MDLKMFSRRFGSPFPFLGLALFLFPSAFAPSGPRQQEQSSSQQQQQSSQNQQQSTPSEQNAQQQTNPQPSPQTEPKRKKVWTNDDVVSLRTPADTYQVEKEAREAAEAEQAAKDAAEAKLIKEAGLEMKLPSTVEETQKLIKAKESQITDDQNALDRYIVELPNEPADRRDKMEEEIKRIKAELPKEQLALKVLQNHLQKLTKAQLSQPPEPAAPPPSTQDQPL
jgi:hypothetical protein